MKSEFYGVLKPQEVKSIIEVIPKMKHKMAFKTALYTGMRFKELHDFSKHAEWFKHEPSYQTWQIDLQRWASLAGIEDAINISAGTLRKTWESWLLESGYPEIRVMASQGHSSATSFKHYYNKDWSPEEREQIKKETAVWM